MDMLFDELMEGCSLATVMTSSMGIEKVASISYVPKGPLTPTTEDADRLVGVEEAQRLVHGTTLDIVDGGLMEHMIEGSGMGDVMLDSAEGPMRMRKKLLRSNVKLNHIIVTPTLPAKKVAIKDNAELQVVTTTSTATTTAVTRANSTSSSGSPPPASSGAPPSPRRPRTSLSSPKSAANSPRSLHSQSLTDGKAALEDPDATWQQQPEAASGTETGDEFDFFESFDDDDEQDGQEEEEEEEDLGEEGEEEAEEGDEEGGDAGARPEDKEEPDRRSMAFKARLSEQKKAVSQQRTQQEQQVAALQQESKGADVPEEDDDSAEDLVGADDKLKPFLVPGDDINDRFNCSQVQGVYSHPSILLLCDGHLYIIENYKLEQVGVFS